MSETNFPEEYTQTLEADGVSVHSSLQGPTEPGPPPSLGTPEFSPPSRFGPGGVTAQPRLEPVFQDVRAQEAPAQETPAPLDIEEESWGPRWRASAFNVFGARPQIGAQDPAEGSRGDPEPGNERTPKRRLIGVPGNVDLGSLRPAGEMRTGDQLILKALREESSRRWAEAARLGLATQRHNRLTEPEPLLSHVTGVPPPELTHDLLSMAFQQGYLLRALSVPGQAIGGATGKKERIRFLGRASSRILLQCPHSGLQYIRRR